MTIQAILNAAALIGDIDPVMSRAFIEQPFQRHNLVTAFWNSLQGTRFENLADNIAVAVRAAIDADTPDKPTAKKNKVRGIFVGGKRHIYIGGEFDAVSFENISDAGWINITSIGSENLYFSFTTDSGEVLPGFCKCL